MHGIMRQDINLISTSLKLQKGQKVSLSPARESLAIFKPEVIGYFARPTDGKWSDGIDHDSSDAILIGPDDVCIVGTQGLHEDIEDESGVRKSIIRT